MISLTVRAYTAAGAHHMALALFEATKSEKLTAHAYGALLQSCLQISDVDASLGVIDRLERGDVAMAPRVYEVLIRAAVMAGASDQANTVLDTVLSLLPVASLRALSGATLRAMARAALRDMDLDGAVRYVTAMDDATACRRECLALATSLASISAGARHLTGSRTALRLARVLRGEPVAGLLCTVEEARAGRAARKAADEADEAVARSGGVVLPAAAMRALDELGNFPGQASEEPNASPNAPSTDGLQTTEAASAAGSRPLRPDLAPSHEASLAAAWKVAVLASATGAGAGDPGLAAEAFAWAETLPPLPQAVVGGVSRWLLSPGNGLRLPLVDPKTGKRLAVPQFANGSKSEALRARNRGQGGTLAAASAGSGPGDGSTGGVVALTPQSLTRGVLAQLACNGVMAKAAAGDAAGTLEAVRLAAFDEAAAEAAKRSGGAITPVHHRLARQSVLQWGTMCELATSLAGEGAMAGATAQAIELTDEPVPKVQGRAAAQQMKALQQELEQMLGDGRLEAQPGIAATADGLSVHGLARCLQLLCHVGELTADLSTTIDIICSVLSGTVPSAAKEAVERDATVTRAATSLANAFVEATLAAAGTVEGMLGETGTPSLATRRRKGLLSSRTIGPDALDELSRVIAGTSATAKGASSLVRNVLGQDMAVSSRAAVALALARPAEVVAAIDALMSVVPIESQSKTAVQALKRLRSTDMQPLLAASERDAPWPEVCFNGAEAVADAAAAAVAALASPRSFINHGQIHLVHGIAQLNDAGLLFGPRCREYMLAGYSRIGLIGSALELASTMRAEPAEPGSSSWAWQSLPAEGAMHILRACALRGDAAGSERAMQLVHEACEGERIGVPAEALRLMSRVDSRRAVRTPQKRGGALAGRIEWAAAEAAAPARGGSGQRV